MSIASVKAVPEDMRTSMIRIYSYKNRNPKGVFYNLYYGRKIVFENLTQLLFLMEDLMDSMGYPQASVKGRGFRDVPQQADRASLMKQMDLDPDQKALATFKVKVLFRQSASWQGRVWWVDQEKEMSFRSAPELIKLIDSTLPQPENKMPTVENEVADIG